MARFGFAHEPEFIERVLAVARTEVSFSAVATANGLTKNAVCGIVHRAREAGEDLHGVRPAGRAKTPPAPPVRSAPAAPATVAAAITPTPDPVPPPAPVAIETPAVRPVPKHPGRPVHAPLGVVAAVVGIGMRQCHYPLGEIGAADFRFCCARVPAIAPSEIKRFYCEEHRAIVSPGVAKPARSGVAADA